MDFLLLRVPTSISEKIWLLAITAENIKLKIVSEGIKLLSWLLLVEIQQ